MPFKSIFPPKRPPHPFEHMGKKELMDALYNAHQQNLQLGAEITRIHENDNHMRRVLNNAYAFMFGIVHSYKEVADEYRSREAEKVVPTLWLAARVCEQFEDMYKHHPMTDLAIGPERKYLRHVYKMAMRPINPTSKLGEFLEEPLEEPVNGGGDAA